MSKGTDSRGTRSSEAKANRAFLSMKRRINHAEADRSIPGRGRVTHSLPMYARRLALGASFVEDGDISVRASNSSTRFWRGLLKKSISTISRNRAVSRLTRLAGRFSGGTDESF